MDLIDSEDEELPTNLDLTASFDARSLTAATAQSSTLPDRTGSQALPPSPGTARKRTNEEVYQRSQLPVASTTPLKTPPKKMSQFARQGFTLPADSQDTVVATEGAMQDSMEQTAQTSTEKTFAQSIQAYQEQLEQEFNRFEKSLVDRNKKDPLEDLDWDDLEQRYLAEIRPKEADEHAIIEELQTRFQQFFLWMQVSRERESNRAIKRLRTRAAYVQHSEQQLVQKQEHFSKVLEAFHSAMNLLSHG